MNRLPPTRLKRMRSLMAILGLLLSPSAFGADAVWLQSVNYDSLNKLNLKEGIAFLAPTPEPAPQPDGKWTFQDVPFKYADLELGMEGVKATVGAGVVTGPEMPILPRIGISYAHLKSQDLAGVEAVLSAGAPADEGLPVPVGITFKIGVYRGLNGTPNRWMLGLGFGL